MFLPFYELREQPFGVTPDPRYLYLSETHREALASLFYGIEAGRGFQALIAPPGMGKTTLIFRLLERLRSSAQTAFLFQTQCDSREFFRYLLSDLGINASDQNVARMHESLNAVLLNNARTGRNFVLIIDEAQNLDDSVLETVRLLSDFETPRAKLMQIVLVGQPQLADKLASPSLMQLRQRISLVSRLHPLTRSETLVYIEYRLLIAGQTGAPLFTYDAIELISSFSGGIPRNINNICFNALTLGYAKRQKRIDASIVREVLADLDLDALSSQRVMRTQTALNPLSPFDDSVPLDQSSYQALHDAIRAGWSNNGAPEPKNGSPVSEGTADPREVRCKENQADPVALEKMPTLVTPELANDQKRALARELAVLLSSMPPPVAQTASVAVGQQEPPRQPQTRKKESTTSTVAPGEAAGISSELSQLEVPAPGHEKLVSSNAAQLAAEAETLPAVGNGRLSKTTIAPTPVPLANRAHPNGRKSWARDMLAATSKASAKVWSWLLMRRSVANGQEKRGSLRSGASIVVLFAVLGLNSVIGTNHGQSVGARGDAVPTSIDSTSASLLNPSPSPDPSQASKTPTPPHSTWQQRGANEPVDVTVHKGQTLSGISLRYMGRFDTKVAEEIQTLNPKIKDPDLILAGQRVHIPRPARESADNPSSP